MQRLWMIGVLALVGCGGDGGDGATVEGVTDFSTLDFTPGRYELAVATSLEGFPNDSEPDVVEVCLRAADSVTSESVDVEECDVEYRVAGNTLAFEQVCRFEAVLEYVGSLTFRGDSFDGEYVTRQDGALLGTTTLSGRRVGDCE